MILMYSKSSFKNKNKNELQAVYKNFYRQMNEISNKEVVYLSEYDPSNPEQVVITFNGLYREVIQYAVPIMNKFGYPFEVFITSEYLEEENTVNSIGLYTEFINVNELKQVIKAGGRVQWHTKTHKNLKEVEDKEIIKCEIEIPEELRSLDVNSFKWFAYPHGEFNDTVLSYIKESFEGAVSCNQGNDNDKYMLNRVTVENDTSLSGERISVIIPSYNYGRYLEEAVESILQQTILPYEILIIDDHSQDNTQDIGEYYANKYPSIVKFYRNSENLGIIKNFNKAVKMTTGEFICFLGGDNIFDSTYLEKTSRTLLQNPQAAIAYTDFLLFGERAKIVYDDFLEERKGEIIEGKYYRIKFPEFDKQKLSKGNYIHGSSMYRRTAFEQVGGYRSEGTDPEDYNLFHRMVLNGWQAKRIAEPILLYRQHSEEQANIKNITLAQLAFYKKDNSQLKSILSHRDKDIKELKDALVQKDKDIHELIDALELRYKDIYELKEAVELKDKDIKEIRAVVKHKEKDIQELRVGLDIREKDVEDLRTALEYKEKDIQELKGYLEHKEKDIQELKEAVEHKERDIEALKDRLERREIDIQELKSELEHKEIDILKLNGTLDKYKGH